MFLWGCVEEGDETSCDELSISLGLLSSVEMVFGSFFLWATFFVFFFDVHGMV
jgi:hypothetical protein